jgi:ankyrin repeat protein
MFKNELFIVLFFFSFYFASGQNAEIDTTDYLLPYFEQANDYNLLIASSKGYASEIDRLIKKGANVDAETIEGATPIIYAVANNHEETVRALLKYNPKVNKVTSDYQTPLLLAVKNQNVEISEILIRGGAEIDMTDNYGAAPLHYASVNGNFYVTDLLLYYDAEVDKKSNDGTTPLMAAIWSGSADVADLLIQNGANMEARDNQGFTPFLIAAQNGDTLLMKVLLKYGINLYEKNIYNYNALDLAIESDHRPAVELLLEKGDKWAAAENEGINPYRIASAFGNKDYMELLDKKNIPGKVRPSIDVMAITVSAKFTMKDIYSSIQLSFKEPLLSGGLTAGVDTKIWYTRVLTKSSENVYYQYMDKSSVIYAGLFKDFKVTGDHKKSSLEATTSLSAGYTFGNKLKGTNIVPDNKFLIIPAAGLKLEMNHFILSAGLEYYKTPYYHIGPLWCRIGCSYKLYLSKVRSPGKTIKWY